MNAVHLVGKSPLENALHSMVAKTTPHGCNALTSAWKSAQSLIAKTLESPIIQPLPPAEPVGYIMPYIHAVIEKIAEAWNGFVDFLSRHTPEGIKLGCKQFVTACKEFVFSIPSYFSTLFTKVQELWISIQPHLQTVAAFMQSHLGMSLGLFTGGIVCFHLSQNVQSRIASVAFFTLGLGTTVAGGMFLMNTGIIPALPIVIKIF